MRLRARLSTLSQLWDQAGELAGVHAYLATALATARRAERSSDRYTVDLLPLRQIVSP